MGVRAILACGLVAVSCWARQDSTRQQQDPAQLLMEIRRKVAASISRLPRYLCTETVERKSLAPDPWAGRRKDNACAEIVATAQNPKTKLQLFSSDRLRLDVAIASNGEMYSWVGSGKFADATLGDLVKQGATSTGSFGSFLQAIFVSDVATFAFKGEKQSDGRRVLEYTFEVPLWRSGYQVGNRIVTRVTGYSGSFMADAGTLAILRLEIHTDPLPAELEMCFAATTLDYTQVRMNNLDFLLPSETNMRIVNTDGSESRNRTEFTGCHQFLGESKLIFDEPAAMSAAGSDAKFEDAPLPSGLEVSVALAQSIDSATAAAGDPVTGKLTKAIKDPVSGAVMAKGTKLNGRIFELRSSYGLGTAVELGLKWESMELNGVNHSVELSLKSAVAGSAKNAEVHVRWPAPAVDSGADPGVGYFDFPEVRKHYQIPAGFEAEWVTLSPATPAK
jgi:hypothetical protein